MIDVKFEPTDEANRYTSMTPSTLRVYESSLSVDGERIATVAMLDHRGRIDAALRLNAGQVHDLIHSLYLMVAGETLSEALAYERHLGYEEGYADGDRDGWDRGYEIGAEAVA